MAIASRRCEEALARGHIYRFLSTAFAYPVPVGYTTLQAELSQEAARARALLGWPVEEFDTACHALRNCLHERFEAEHVAAFGHTTAADVPAYEARYGARHLFQETQCMADVAGFYRAFGFEEADAARERPDHIAVELEFMHVLAIKEAVALGHGWIEQVEVCRDAQAQFLRDHLGRWTPTFLRRLADHAKGGIFAMLAGITAACLQADCRGFGLQIGKGELDLAPIDHEPVGSDFSCGIAECGGEPTLIGITRRVPGEEASVKEEME